jgi:tripartite-type tricarboxylate transporter receptor subunit TctC
MILAAGCASLSPAQAENYPNKPITWIVPFAAGGPTDSLARLMADRVGRELGQSIIVENTPGAGGTIGAARAAQASPDGYTMLVGHFGYMAAAPSLYTKLRYDPVKDFKGIFRFPDTPMVLLVNAQTPYHSLQDLLSAARAQPGALNIANAGVGSASHLTAALFAQSANIDVQGIPYRGGGQALTDVMGGQADAIFDQTNTVMGLAGSDKVRPLAQTSPTRSKLASPALKHRRGMACTLQRAHLRQQLTVYLRLIETPWPTLTSRKPCSSKACSLCRTANILEPH